MNDIFNTIETEIKTLLASDTAITTEVPANNFHEKLLADIRRYYEHELPAVAIHSIGYSRGEDGITRIINAIIEVVHRGGDLASIDGKVKKIMSLIIDKLEDENGAYGDNLSQEVDDIYVTDADVIPSQSENTFLVSGLIIINCHLLEP